VVLAACLRRPAAGFAVLAGRFASAGAGRPLRAAFFLVMASLLATSRLT
jgi:hypothetical protein